MQAIYEPLITTLINKNEKMSYKEFIRESDKLYSVIA